MQSFFNRKKKNLVSDMRSGSGFVVDNKIKISKTITESHNTSGMYHRSDYYFIRIYLLPIFVFLHCTCLVNIFHAIYQGWTILYWKPKGHYSLEAINKKNSFENFVEKRKILRYLTTFTFLLSYRKTLFSQRLKVFSDRIFINIDTLITSLLSCFKKIILMLMLGGEIKRFILKHEKKNVSGCLIIVIRALWRPSRAGSVEGCLKKCALIILTSSH